MKFRGMATDILERLAALVRVYRISPRTEQVEPLLSGGLDSASSISRIPVRRFVLLFFGAVVGLAYLRRRRRRDHGSRDNDDSTSHRDHGSRDNDDSTSHRRSDH
jgi:hypothetical protein